MKKLFKSILLITLFESSLLCQNLGINTANPQHALDVTGNINFTGNLLSNGQAGGANEVLKSNGNGTMAWTSLGAIAGYKNSRIITSSSNFTVPTGVTKVMVELWSGGAGGSGVAGGVSGSYGRITKNVVAGNSLVFIIGAGGDGQVGPTLPTGGGFSKVTFPDTDFLTIFGGGAPSGLTWQGYPGGFGILFNNPDYFQPGNIGEMMQPKIYPYPNNQFIEVVDTGKGGTPPGINYNSQSFASSMYVRRYNSTGGLIDQKINRPPYVANPFPATGGGYDTDTSGQVGGSGLAIVWW